MTEKNLQIIQKTTKTARKAYKCGASSCPAASRQKQRGNVLDKIPIRQNAKISALDTSHVEESSTERSFFLIT